MTEAVQIALIANVTTIIVVILSRLWSHVEHRKTAEKVDDTNQKVTKVAKIINGKETSQ